jgi:hypothetical protein
MVTEPTHPADYTGTTDTAGPTAALSAPTASLAPPPLPLAAPPAIEEPRATSLAPRVRWAGIVWGAVFAVIAGTALWTLAEASRLSAISEWLRTLSPADLNPGWVIGIVVLAGGLLLLILGGVALLRNAQLRMTVER